MVVTVLLFCHASLVLSTNNLSNMSNTTYQKTNVVYGSMPSQDTIGSDSASSQLANTKKSQKKSLLTKAAILVATLIAGILIGSAISHDADKWVEKQEKVADTPTTTTDSNPPVACEDHKSNNEADVWAKIKEESLGEPDG